jgi:hypothetical protein
MAAVKKRTKRRGTTRVERAKMSANSLLRLQGAALEFAECHRQPYDKPGNHNYDCSVMHLIEAANNYDSSSRR